MSRGKIKKDRKNSLERNSNRAKKSAKKCAINLAWLPVVNVTAIKTPGAGKIILPRIILLLMIESGDNSHDKGK
jgi:hypothetical protein